MTKDGKVSSFRTEERKPLQVRLDPPSHEWIRTQAFKSRRSMNAEINFLIRLLMEADKASGHVAKQSPDASHVE